MQAQMSLQHFSFKNRLGVGTDKVNLSQIPFRELEAMFVCFFSLTKKNVILDTYLTKLKTGNCKGIIAKGLLV